jgi:hypothetical protein
MMVCASDRAVSFVTQDGTRATRQCQLHSGSTIRHLPPLGVFAAIDLRTNTLVWGSTGRTSASGVAVTAGGWPSSDVTTGA